MHHLSEDIIDCKECSRFLKKKLYCLIESPYLQMLFI